LERIDRKVIGITGSPATGKKKVGNILAKLLEYEFLDLNQHAIEKKAISGKDDSGFIVDLEQMKKISKKTIKGKRIVIVGHLIPSIFQKNDIDIIVVLRCSPSELTKRYLKRNYSKKKIKENISAEILDISYSEAINQFGKGKIAVFDTTHTKSKDIAKKIIKLMKKSEIAVGEPIDWLKRLTNPELLNKYFIY
jgi:adenylate kinase